MVILNSNNEVFYCFQELLNRVENQYDVKFKIFRSDNGMKFINNNFRNLFKEKIIIH